MKQCPKCRTSFSQRKKGGCPECGEPLFLYKGKMRRESDKTLAIKIREYVKPQIEKNLGVGGYLMLNQEWVFAYRLIDTLREWLNSQPIKVMPTSEFVFVVLDNFLKDSYWKTHLRSLAGVQSQCLRVAMTEYRNLKLQAEQAKVQEQRIHNANLNQLNISYKV